MSPPTSRHVKGLRDPLAVYEVAGPGPLRTCVQVAAHRGLSRFVGREAELAQLQQAWVCAQAAMARSSDARRSEERLRAMEKRALLDLERERASSARLRNELDAAARRAEKQDAE